MNKVKLHKKRGIVNNAIYVYPIIYKRNKYIVRFLQEKGSMSLIVYSTIFQFNMKKKLFRGNKGKLMYASSQCDFSLDVNGVTLLNIIPEKIKELFIFWKEESDEDEEQLKDLRNTIHFEKWDGNLIL